MNYIFLSVTIAMGVLTNLLASEDDLKLLSRRNLTAVAEVTYTIPKAAQSADVPQIALKEGSTQTEIGSLQLVSERTNNELLEKLVTLLAEKRLSIIPTRPLNQAPEVIESTLTPQNLYRELQNAFSGLDRTPEIFHYNLISEFNNLLMPSSLAVGEVDLIKRRIDEAARVVRSYFDSVIEYKKWNIYHTLTVQNINTIAMCILFNVLVYYTPLLQHFPTLSPMAGGTCVLTLNFAVVYVAASYKADKSPSAIAHNKWGEKLSISKVKSYISQLIAQTFVFNNDDKYPEYIRSRLEKTLSNIEVDDYTFLFKTLFPRESTTDLRLVN